MPEFSRDRFLEIPRESLEQIYRNPALQRSLDAMGVDPQECGVFLDRQQGSMELRTIDFHHRTVDRRLQDPLRVKTKTSDRVFAHFDLKGVGFIAPETHESKKEEISRGSLADADEVYVLPKSTENAWGYDVLGLFDERMLNLALKNADYLAPKGFRGEAFAAAYRLKHVWIGGKETSTREFIQQQSNRIREKTELAQDESEKKRLERVAQDLEENFSPVLAVRCMRSVFRIRDLADARPELAKSMLRETIDNLKQESRVLGQQVPDFDVDNPNGLTEYVKSIIEWIGHNLGILKREGLTHNYLHMGNISLAGEVVDLDSIQKVVRVSKLKMVFTPSISPDWRMMNAEDGIPLALEKDIRDAVVSCKNFIKIMKKLGYTVDDGQTLSQAFLRGWRREIRNSELYASLGASYEKLDATVESMVLKGIRDGEALKRLSAY